MEASTKITAIGGAAVRAQSPHRAAYKRSTCHSPYPLEEPDASIPNDNTTQPRDEAEVSIMFGAVEPDLIEGRSVHGPWRRVVEI